MRILAIIAMTIFLMGCPFVKTEYEVRPVPVPVVIHSEVIPPEIEDMQRLPIYDLTAESSDEETTKAIEESIIILESYKEELLQAVRPFQKAAQSNRENSQDIARKTVSRVQEAIDKLLARQNEQEEE